MTPIRTDYNHFVELIMKMKSQVCNTSIFALVTIGFISAIIGNFFFEVFSFLYAQSPAHSKIDYILRDEWKNGQWVEKEKALFVYDADDRAQYSITLVKKTDEWVLQDSSQFFYDRDSHLKKEEHLSLCILGNCMLLSRELSQYDDQGRKTEQRWQDYKDGDWADKWKTTIEYNDADNSLESLRLIWEDGQWINPRKWIRRFDNSGKEMSADASRGLDNEWEPTWKLTWTRNPKNQTAERLTKSWENGKWVDYHLDLYKYDEAGEEVEQIRQNRENGQWISEYRKRHFYK